MNEFLTTILLCSGVMLISLGVHRNYLILTIIGGFMLGMYNSVVNY